MRRAISRRDFTKRAVVAGVALATAGLLLRPLLVDATLANASEPAKVPSTQPATRPAVVIGERPMPADDLPSTPAGKAWRLAWHDEFNGTKLDETRWNVPPDARRRDGWWMRKAISLDGQGHLVLRTFEEDGKYIDGCVRTLGTFEHAYGYYVARIRLQRQPGHWPAFWLMGRNVGRVGDEGRDGSEVDIMEKPWMDDRVNHAIHWDGYGKEHKSAAVKATAPGLMEGFHTYSLWWSSDEYVFYIDGRETWRTKAGGVCQAPLFIKLSDEIGTWAGDIKKAKLPDEFIVDYVRVYDLVDMPGR